jgi:hypothetical protein
MPALAIETAGCETLTLDAARLAAEGAQQPEAAALIAGALAARPAAPAPPPTRRCFRRTRATTATRRPVWP